MERNQGYKTYISTKQFWKARLLIYSLKKVNGKEDSFPVYKTDLDKSDESRLFSEDKWLVIFV